MSYTKSQVIPESHRANVMNWFRVPMNIITCAALLCLHVDWISYDKRLVFGACLVLCFMGLYATNALLSLPLARFQIDACYAVSSISARQASSATVAGLPPKAAARCPPDTSRERARDAPDRPGGAPGAARAIRRNRSGRPRRPRQVPVRRRATEPSLQLFWSGVSPDSTSSFVRRICIGSRRTPF